MAYTQEDFQEQIFQIGFKMDYFTREFAEKEGLNLDYSMQSLDDLEAWILAHYEDHHALIADRKMLNYLTVYIGETFRKHLGGKWFIELKIKKRLLFYACIDRSIIQRRGIQSTIDLCNGLHQQKKWSVYQQDIEK